jgi:hypothetical protein
LSRSTFSDVRCGCLFLPFEETILSSGRRKRHLQVNRS